MTSKPKYQLPGRDGGFFYRDDEQLRCSFRLWVRWLPCSVLWRMAVWNYYHAKPVSKRRSLLSILLLAGGSTAIAGVILMQFTGAALAVSILLVILLVILAFYAGAVLAS